MVKKYLISDRFDFLGSFFSRVFYDSVRAFFISFGQEGVCNFKITSLFQSLFSVIKLYA